MEEKPRVVISSRTRRVEPVQGGFTFTSEMVNLAGPLKDYRRQAWLEFDRLPMPTTRDEAWRRTDLRSMPAAGFHLPSRETASHFQAVPDAFLKPLAGDKHGGQVVVLPDRAEISLDPALEKQGVIFTDLKTAEL